MRGRGAVGIILEMGKEKTMLWVSALTLLGLGAGFYLLWKDPALSMQLVGAALVFVSTIAAAVAALIQWCCCAQRGTRDPRTTQSGGPKAKKLLYNQADVGETRVRRRQIVKGTKNVVVTFQQNAGGAMLQTDGNQVRAQGVHEDGNVIGLDRWHVSVCQNAPNQGWIACQSMTGIQNVIPVVDQNDNTLTADSIEEKFELQDHVVLFLKFLDADGNASHGVFSVRRKDLEA